MRNFTILILAIVAICVMFYAGVNGINNDHSSGPFFIFLGICCSTGLGIDVNRFIREKIRRSNIKRFGR